MLTKEQQNVRKTAANYKKYIEKRSPAQFEVNKNVLIGAFNKR